MTQHANEMFGLEELNEVRVLQPTKKFIVERFRPWVEDHGWDVLLLPRHLLLDHWPTMPCAFLGCIKTDIWEHLGPLGFAGTKGLTIHSFINRADVAMISDIMFKSIGPNYWVWVYPNE